MKKFHGSRVPIPNKKKITATRPLSRLETIVLYNAINKISQAQKLMKVIILICFNYLAWSWSQLICCYQVISWHQNCTHLLSDVPLQILILKCSEINQYKLLFSWTKFCDINTQTYITDLVILWINTGVVGEVKTSNKNCDNKRGKCLFLMMSYPAQCERTNMSHMPQQQAIIVFRCIMFNNNRQYYRPITNLKYLMEVLLVDTRIQENVMFPTRM